MAADAVVRKAPALRAVPAVDRCAKIGPLPGTPNLPGGYIFGFTAGTDPGAACEWDFASENDFRWQKRDGRYFAGTTKSEFNYGLTRDLVLSLSLFTDYHRWSNVTSVQEVLASQGDGVFRDRLSLVNIDGLSGEFFARVLERRPGQPVGIALGVEPRWSRFDRTTGYRAEGYAVEFKFMLDAVLTERLFAAFNLNYGLGTQRFDIPNAPWVRASATNVSGAVTAQLYAAEKQLIEGVFLGVEARYRSVFAGLVLDRMVGDAFNLGPTFAILFPGERIINIAWSPQCVWPRPAGQRARVVRSRQLRAQRIPNQIRYAAHRRAVASPVISARSPAA